MRLLLLMRGAPGCGKSTWIEQQGLQPCTLCADDIRTMCQSPVLGVDGKFTISQENDKKVWDILFDLLKTRMARGELTVIDATNSKTADMTRYKNLASEYRYRIVVVDMTDVPEDICKQRNALRPEYKRVPDHVIANMYARFATQKVPSGIKVIKPDEISSVWYSPIDLSHYKKIHHIGDIHGCYTALMDYLGGDLHEDEFYIFLGDYIDRGLESPQVVKYLSTICQRPNVLLLEGNHERWLNAYGHDVPSRSPEFEHTTRKQLVDSGFAKKEARILYRKFAQCAFYTYGDKTVLVTHGGLSHASYIMSEIATEEMIKGTGTYGDYLEVADSFVRNTPDGVYQIFGHRNTESSPVQLNERCFDLAGAVEFGGYLRAVTLDADGFHTHEVENHVYRELPKHTGAQPAPVDVEQMIASMRANKYVTEKKFGNISSFNFSSKAFYGRVWDEQTTRARGMFIDTVNNKVVARSYEKFFNVNERTETKFGLLKHTLQFPVTAYVKENGFLGMVSYDHEKDDLFIASKSTPEGPYAQYLKDIFYGEIQDISEVKKYLKANNVTLVLECIDPLNDPHIIKYDKAKVVLLDVVYNDIQFKKMPYEDADLLARKFKLEHKRRACVIPDWPSFCTWYKEVTADGYLYDGSHIEGFVVEDAEGYMVKLKLAYYRFWKHMRGVVDSVNRYGYYARTSSLFTQEANLFYGWVREQFAKGLSKRDIISLRDEFHRHFSFLLDI